MTNPNFNSSFEHELATPEQARELFQEVGILTTFQGKNLGDRNTFGNVVEMTPSEVASHLPEPQDTSESSEDSVYVVQIFDRETGQPRQDGVVGMVTFKRAERVDPQLIYAANANYHITKEGEAFGVERHVSHTEHGRHKVTEKRRQQAQIAIDPSAFALEQLSRLGALKKSKVDASRPVEQSLGMFDVTLTEVQQIIDFVRSINKPESR
ncbi:MAG: hypothetical protein WAW80_04080 [Candidatus Saccharimonadales bacterium]